MSTPSSRAVVLRGGLVGACSVLITALAHAAGGGGIPAGSALVALVMACAVVGAGVVVIDVTGRRSRSALVVAALCAGEGLGHLVLTAGGDHHDAAPMASPLQMFALHVIAAFVLGVLIGAVEYLYVVCSSVVSWLRLFADDAPAPAAMSPRRYSYILVLESVLLRAGSGMRAPPGLTG